MSEPLSAAEIALGREVCAAATPEPWFNGADPSHFDCPEVTDRKTFAYYVTTDQDARFIAVARRLLPRLLDMVEK